MKTNEKTYGDYIKLDDMNNTGRKEVGRDNTAELFSSVGRIIGYQFYDTFESLGKDAMNIVLSWKATAYDNYNVVNSNKEAIHMAAARAGMSMNKFVQTAILEKMGLDDWPLGRGK